MHKEDTRYIQDAEQEFVVEIAYALPNQQLIVPVRAYSGMTAEQAIQASGILSKFPDIDLNFNKIGIFGKLSKLDALLRHQDRVEIYRPLIADPKELRKKRVFEGKMIKKEGNFTTPPV